MDRSAAFDAMLLDHRDFMFKSALKLTHNVDKAYDLVQDTIVKALMHSCVFDSEKSFRPWIYTVMKRTYIDQFRTAKASAYSESIEIIMEPPESEKVSKQHREDLLHISMPAPQVPFVELRDVETYVNSLPDNLQHLFKLHFIDEMSHSEISDHLDLPLGTVKTRLRSFRTKLVEQTA